MSGKGGRPRTFPAAAVPLALVERERTGRTWVEIAQNLKVSPGTLRARVSDYRRESGAHKTPAKARDGSNAGAEAFEGGET
jgi:hypothetical protein